MLGILQRYVMGEVLRSFTLALLTITSVLVLFMVMLEATKTGLTPSEILRLVPFVIPGSLPYTVPVSLLLAVTVVYGRLSSDNELVAMKSAGLSAFFALGPALALGVVLSVTLLYLTHDAIPRANHQAKMIIFKNMEEVFYRFLKTQREFNNPKWPFLITVRDVDGKTMLDPTFKHRIPGAKNPNTFDMVIQAKTARIHFNTEKKQATVYLDGAEVINPSKDVSLINNTELEMPLPNDRQALAEKKIQERTTPEMVRDQAQFRLMMLKERKRQAMAASLWIGTGRLHRVDWLRFHRSFVDYGSWENNWRALEAEKHMRIALSCSSFFFVLLGAPVGMYFERRDFLSAFISCFLPIIVVYYPLILGGTNMAKDGFNATVALWMGNVVLAIASGFVLPSVMRH